MRMTLPTNHTPSLDPAILGVLRIGYDLSFSFSSLTKWIIEYQIHQCTFMNSLIHYFIETCNVMIYFFFMLDHKKGNVTQYRYLDYINHFFKMSLTTEQWSLMIQSEVSQRLPCN